MTCMISRRQLLSLSAAGLLAACTTTTQGGSTTATLDVAKIVADSTAILSGLSSLLTMPAVIIALGVHYAAAEAALVAAQVALAEIEKLTNGSISVTVDTSTVQPLVTTLLSDVQTVLALVQGALATMTGSAAARVADAVSAVLALIPFVRLAAGFAGAMPAAGAMDEQQALAALRRDAR